MATTQPYGYIVRLQWRDTYILTSMAGFIDGWILRRVDDMGAGNTEVTCAAERLDRSKLNMTGINFFNFRVTYA